MVSEDNRNCSIFKTILPNWITLLCFAFREDDVVPIKSKLSLSYDSLFVESLDIGNGL